MKPEYCIQNDGDCQSCSLSSYSLDCTNQRFAFSIRELAMALIVPERTIRKLLNDAGAKIDEYAINPDETVSRELVIDLFAIRAGDRVGRVLAGLLS